LWIKINARVFKTSGNYADANICVRLLDVNGRYGTIGDDVNGHRR
jgi:hypothetical protein